MAPGRSSSGDDRRDFRRQKAARAEPLPSRGIVAQFLSTTAPGRSGSLFLQFPPCPALSPPYKKTQWRSSSSSSRVNVEPVSASVAAMRRPSSGRFAGLAPTSKPSTSLRCHYAPAVPARSTSLWLTSSIGSYAAESNLFMSINNVSLSLALEPPSQPPTKGWRCLESSYLSRTSKQIYRGDWHGRFLCMLWSRDNVEGRSLPGLREPPARDVSKWVFARATADHVGASGSQAMKLEVAEYACWLRRSTTGDCRTIHPELEKTT